MAKPIEPTPVLEGKDAVAFLRATESASYSKKKERFLKRCEEIYLSTKKK